MTHIYLHIYIYVYHVLPCKDIHTLYMWLQPQLGEKRNMMKHFCDSPRRWTLKKPIGEPQHGVRYCISAKSTSRSESVQT